jgi:hypothetical protein
LLFPKPLEYYTNLLGSTNYYNHIGNLLFHDVPIMFDSEWTNLEDRQKGVLGSEKDTRRTVNSIDIWLGYHDPTNEFAGEEFMGIVKQHQHILTGFIMMDSVLVHNQSNVDFVNEEIRKKKGDAPIKQILNLKHLVGYTYYYPETTRCTPIADKTKSTTISITISTEYNHTIRSAGYGYDHDRAE